MVSQHHERLTYHKKPVFFLVYIQCVRLKAVLKVQSGCIQIIHMMLENYDLSHSNIVSIDVSCFPFYVTITLTYPGYINVFYVQDEVWLRTVVHKSNV